MTEAGALARREVSRAVRVDLRPVSAASPSCAVPPAACVSLQILNKQVETSGAGELVLETGVQNQAD